jgi:hypothetical protein
MQGYAILISVNVSIDGVNVLSQSFRPNQQGYPTPITLTAPVNLSAGTHTGQVDISGTGLDQNGNMIPWGETVVLSINYSSGGGGGGGGGAPGSNSKVLVGVLALTGIALGALVVVAKKKK